MPRRPRVVLPGVPLHIIQRGNNRCACFYAEDDCRFYLEWLEKCAVDHGCQVHAYVLMTNHVHLLLSFDQGGAPGAMMKALGQRYVQYANRTYRRSGTLWEGRFRSALVQAESYLLLCQRYIELNPVRAGMVDNPADYPWSSYRCNALGVENPLVSPHALYWSLGGDVDERLMAYRELFRSELEPGVVDQLRAVTNGNFVLGDERFSAQVAEALGRRVTPGVSGRPRSKSAAEEVLPLN